MKNDINTKSGSLSPENIGNKKISEYLNEMNHNIENRELINKRKSVGYN